MQQLLLNLLGPIFYGMGVSEADLTSYLGMCMNYVYGILAALVILIIVLIAAQWLKKGIRGGVRLSALAAFLLAVTVMVNSMCYGPLKTNISTFLNGSGVNLQEETIEASKDVIARVGEEGLVLVKNDGLLPLSGTTALNVFGWGSTNPIFGGTGSGSSDGSTAVGILQSLQNAGFQTNQSLTDMYVAYQPNRPTVAMQSQDWTLPEPTVDKYTDELMSEAKSFSDTAVIVISRSGGEGADLPTDMNAVIHGTYNLAEKVSVIPAQYGYTNATYTNNGDYDDFEPGEHFLELSVTEENMVEKVCSEFEKVVVIINANNPMELGWVEDYPQIGAVILAPGAGNTGFTGLGEIISGAVNPSGHTIDTYVRDLTRTPTWNNFGNFHYSNVDDLKQAILAADPAYEGNMAFVNYVEGIYVGYKFYETAAEEGLINYEEEVQYPFGYGLSYTTFDEKIEGFAADGENITFDVTVTNTGSVAGKDVVEIYFTPPYENGGIEKASVNLIDFAKTSELAAGASETISFSIPKEDLASYDSGLKVNGGGYILEAGEYKISVRSDSHTVVAEESFTVDADVNYSAGRSTDLVPVTNQFEDYSRGDFEQLSRKDGFANYETATAAPSDDAKVMSDEVRSVIETYAVGFYDPTAFDDAADEMPTLGAQNGLTLYDLYGKAYDDPAWDQLLDQLTFEDMATMINVGGWQTAAIESVGKVATSDCDGPAGLSNFITGAYGTAYPAEVLMAQTWNTDLIYEMGEKMAQEYVDANNYGWYGPAMNTHRNAFAGRNFEYYSEDGVLAGKMAMAECNGAATKNVYPYIKHFALNDQETNRCSFLLTFASEQAIREIYLKPFEIATKGFTGTSRAVMSSFNWIGTEPSCANDNLLQNVLRGEWGFVGMVETDYDGSYGYMISDHCVRNGNDLMLGFAMAQSNVFSDTSATATKAMRQACKNILYTVGNSGYYANGDPADAPDKMDQLFKKINLGAGIVILAIFGLALLMFRSGRNGRKQK
ncbi:MAG: glycoside hydrolase family 3 C-terminal domain-containing protein [Lachnospiraceae bacterium]|nr:glycoside hydrolase family 3 C-terminal domain-containing protein [Lachnospiraceae bacterium]